MHQGHTHEGEVSDDLPAARFEDLEVVAREIGDRLIVAIGDDNDVHGDVVSGGAEDGLLPLSGGADERDADDGCEERSAGQTGHGSGTFDLPSNRALGRTSGGCGGA